jgi:hypothetical protein
MAAAVRHTWMFRTAAAVFLLFGAFALWRYGLTDYEPAQRPVGLGLGGIGLAIGVFLFMRKRLAIGCSALVAGLVCLAATAAAPQAHGPVILFFAAIALVTCIYAVLALRVLFGPRDESANRS